MGRRNSVEGEMRVRIMIARRAPCWREDVEILARHFGAGEGWLMDVSVPWN